MWCTVCSWFSITGSILRAHMELVGDHIPPTGEVIEIHLAESKQLFKLLTRFLARFLPTRRPPKSSNKTWRVRSW